MLSVIAVIILFRVVNDLPRIKSGITYQTTRRHVTGRLAFSVTRRQKLTF